MRFQWIEAYLVMFYMEVIHLHIVNYRYIQISRKGIFSPIKGLILYKVQETGLVSVKYSKKCCFLRDLIDETETETKIS